ncbi:MAG: WYL domain-containing protein [Bacillota bacterium]
MIGRWEPRDKLRDFVIRRRVTPQGVVGRRLFTPEGELDVPEETSFDTSASAAIQIVYVDAAGRESERRVSCRQILARGWPEAVFGYCHERKAVREFRIDRIRELYDLSTGEQRDPGPYFDALLNCGALGRKDEVLCDFARLLVFMARCDGEYHPLEEAALQDALGRYLRHYGGDDEDLEDLIERCDGIAPEGVNVIHSVATLVRCPERKTLARIILDSTGSMIDADGRHAPEEVAWALELSDALKTAASD